MKYFTASTFREATAIGLGCAVRVARHIVALTVGLGWDRDNPLRPWPWLCSKPTRHGGVYHCLSLCGVFVGLAIQPPKGPPPVLVGPSAPPREVALVLALCHRFRARPTPAPTTPSAA